MDGAQIVGIAFILIGNVLCLIGAVLQLMDNAKTKTKNRSEN